MQKKYLSQEQIKAFRRDCVLAIPDFCYVTYILSTQLGSVWPADQPIEFSSEEKNKSTNGVGLYKLS